MMSIVLFHRYAVLSVVCWRLRDWQSVGTRVSIATKFQSILVHTQEQALAPLWYEPN